MRHPLVEAEMTSTLEALAHDLLLPFFDERENPIGVTIFIKDVPMEVIGVLQVGTTEGREFAAEDAQLGLTEINLAIIPGGGGTQRLPRLVGSSKALEMNLTGDAVLAPEASRWGLADALVPDEELFDTAVAWARKLADQAPLAVEQIKQVSHRGDLDEGIEAEKQGFATAFLSEDGKEGISAFLQKRRAKWQGK